MMHATENAAALRAAIDVAAGRRAADVLIENATLVNVFTGEMQPDTTVSIAGELVAAVGPVPPRARGPHTTVIDAGGAFLLPGYVETHTHIANVFRLHDFARLVVPRGTTTVVTEVTELGSTLGTAGVRWFLDEAAALKSMSIFATAPCFSPPYPELESFCRSTVEEFATLLEHPLIVGIGEAYWPRIIDPDDDTLNLIARARALGKPVQGHSAGARGLKLQAFTAAGIASCHEPITAEEAMERLRLGLQVMIREGSIRRDLEGVAPIRHLLDDFRRVSLSTDGVTSSLLLHEGHLDRLAAKAHRLGFDTVTTVRMLTINAAEAFNLHDRGAIAPARRADIQIVPSFDDFLPSHVITGGRLAAKHGRLTRPVRAWDYPAAARESLRLKPFTADDFRYNDGRGTRVKVRAVRPEIGSMVTFEEIVELPVQEGNILPDGKRSILKYAVINRYGEPHMGRGFLAGTGICRGAVASTLNWEAYQPTVYGATEAEMATAVNRLIELGGGIVVVRGTRVLAELPLPVGGVLGDLAIEEIEAREHLIVAALAELGSELDNPFFHYQTLSFTGLPFIRLTDRGIFDVRRRQPLPLVVTT
ncbi:MAG: adenine deaminase [Deltaproteobacteria bacterium]|nr:adenine deaminase [Candidatus Anaeroferrophillacea bacterium]